MNLLWDRRFLGLFWTQALGAFNDNFFKNALLILVVYKGLTAGGLEEQQLSALAAGMFILPFFLFSATAGQLADKYEKSALIQKIKLVEVCLAGLALVGLLAGSFPLLMAVLGLLGLQSTFFGPLKYGIIPQLLEEEELVSGNALVETGTKLCILIGTIAGGLLADAEKGPILVAAGMLVVALAGWVASLKIPTAPAADPDLVPQWNPITPTIEILKVTRSNRAVFLSILGISWFWLLGGVFLTLFPTYGKSVLQVDAQVVAMFLAIFSVGVGLGAILCQKFSYQRLELGLVPLGSIGVTIFTADLAIIGRPWTLAEGVLLSPAQFVSQVTGVRILLDLLLLSVFTGLFIVPLYTMIQQRTETRYRSRVIAGNNVMNALFMVLSSVFLIGADRMGLGIPQVFAMMAFLNALISLYIYALIPEFFLRFVAYLLAHVVYRLKVVDMEAIPREGPALLVCNHVSFVDWLVVAAAIRRPVRFVMWYTYFRIPIISYLFRDARVIPIASARADEKIRDEAYERIAAELEVGELVCLFPEGAITSDGELAEFKPGAERVVERTPVPVIPMALRGLWGSAFSKFGGGLSRRLFRREFRSRISLAVGEPVPPEDVTIEKLRQEVTALAAEES